MRLAREAAARAARALVLVNYHPALLEGFLARGVVVLMHLAVGNQDEFRAEYHATVLYKG